MGDSLLKDIEQHKIRNGLGTNEKVYLKHFSGANIEHMKSYVIPSKGFDNDLVILHVDTIFFELTLRNKKWLFMGGYNPASETSSYFLDHVSKSLDKTMANYDNILILGDFNSTMSDVPMKNFCELYNLENLIKEPTCYKNPNNPSSIDVILTNNKNSFQNSMATETGLSDHHKMIITVIKNYCKKRNL